MKIRKLTMSIFLHLGHGHVRDGSKSPT